MDELIDVGVFPERVIEAIKRGFTMFGVDDRGMLVMVKHIPLSTGQRIVLHYTVSTSTISVILETPNGKKMTVVVYRGLLVDMPSDAELLDEALKYIVLAH